MKYIFPLNKIIGDCTCTGFPKPIVTWYIDDTKLEDIFNDSSVEITDFTKNEQYLTISYLEVSNPRSGNYKCKCSNTMTTVEGSNHKVTIPGKLISSP